MTELVAVGAVAIATIALAFCAGLLLRVNEIQLMQRHVLQDVERLCDAYNALQAQQLIEKKALQEHTEKLDDIQQTLAVNRSRGVLDVTPQSLRKEGNKS